MDFIAPMVVLVTGALVIGTIFRSFFVNRRLRENAKLWADLQGKVIDRFGSAPEVVRYLESDAGQRMLAGQATAATSPHSRILDSLHLGLLILLGGLGLVVGSGVSDPDVAEVLRTVGKVAAVLGLGYLASAALSWILMKQWGLVMPAGTASSEDRSS